MKPNKVPFLPLPLCIKSLPYPWSKMFLSANWKIFICDQSPLNFSVYLPNVLNAGMSFINLLVHDLNINFLFRLKYIQQSSFYCLKFFVHFLEWAKASKSSFIHTQNKLWSLSKSLEICHDSFSHEYKVSSDHGYSWIRWTYFTKYSRV